MKVIKHGTVNRIKVCGNCQCEFEYDNNDIQIEIPLSSTAAVSYRYVLCPDCGAKIYIDQQVITIPTAPYNPPSVPNTPFWYYDPNKNIGTCTGTGNTSTDDTRLTSKMTKGE